MEAVDQPTLPRTQRMAGFRKQSAGRRQDPGATCQLLAAPFAVVLPVRQREVPLPELAQTLTQALGRLGDQRRNRWQRGAGSRRLPGGAISSARPAVQCPLAQPRQPAPQRRMRRCVPPQPPHRAPQPRPVRVRIDVAPTGLLDDRQTEALERQQFSRQHAQPGPAAPATGQRKLPLLRDQGAVFIPDDDATRHPTARVKQGADRLTLGAGNFRADAFAFDSNGAKRIISDGNRNRYVSGMAYLFRGRGC